MNFAALIIDMQEDFFAHERLSKRRTTLTRCVNELVGICRGVDVPVVWVKQEWAPDLSDAMLDPRKKGVRVVIGVRGRRFPVLKRQEIFLASHTRSFQCRNLGIVDG